jgi:4-hydroxybenzoate polyprenyltransferase
MRWGAYFHVMRISHLIKNVLIFAPLVFSLQFTKNNIFLVTITFIVFSLIASSIYIFNDIADIESDRKHLHKRHRPIASGVISIKQGLVFFLSLFLIGTIIILLLLPPTVFAITTGYFLLNILYSWHLKRIPILDVMVVAIGFVLRILAGAAAITVSVSPWILLCTFFGALFIAFGKRKGEIGILKENSSQIRNVLSSYHPEFLNQLLGTTAAITIITYALYTIDNHTMERFGTYHLLYTVPFVVFGIFRYFQIIYVQSKGDDPTKIFSSDQPMIFNIVLWGIVFFSIVHFHL